LTVLSFIVEQQLQLNPIKEALFAFISWDSGVRGRIWRSQRRNPQPNRDRSKHVADIPYIGNKILFEVQFEAT